MRTTYIGAVRASWMNGRRREAGIDFGLFSLRVRVPPDIEVGDQYRIELIPLKEPRPNAQRKT